MAVCRQCRFWNYEYKKILADGQEFQVGECRIRLPQNSPFFREMFDYEWCGEFEPEKKVTEEKVPLPEVSDTAEKGLFFLENTNRPPARATAAQWDEYMDQLKRILKGEA